MTAGFIGACGESKEVRYDYHVSLRQVTFGSDGRLTAAIDPGRVAQCSDSGNEEFCAWASGPLPRLRVANGRDQLAVVPLSVDNVGPSPYFRAFVTPLAASEAQDQACEDLNLTELVELAPLEAGPDSTTGLFETSVSIPACSAIVLVQTLPPSADAYRVAIVGDVQGDAGVFESVFSRLELRDPSPDFLLFVGELDIEGTPDDAGELFSLAEAHSLPVGVSLTPGDIESYKRVIDRFGALDYATMIGGARFTTIDAADWTPTKSSRGVLERVATCAGADTPDACPPGLFASFVTPVGPSRAIRYQYASDFVGLEVLGQLQARGFDTLIASALGRHDLTFFGALRAIQTPKESSGGLLIASFIPDIASGPKCYDPLYAANDGLIFDTADAPRCGDDALCYRGVCRAPCEELDDCGVGEACFREHVCRNTCTPGDEATDCGDPRARCDDGWCVVEATLNVELATF